MWDIEQRAVVGFLIAYLASCASDQTSTRTSNVSDGVSGQSSGSGGERGTGASSTGGGQSTSCAPGQRLIYEAPGCGSTAQPRCDDLTFCGEFCEAPNQPPRTDYRAYACDCDGKTVVTACCFFDKPFRFWGTCTDAGPTDSGTD